jgi:hypothetical protein
MLVHHLINNEIIKSYLKLCFFKIKIKLKLIYTVLTVVVEIKFEIYIYYKIINNIIPLLIIEINCTILLK